MRTFCAALAFLLSVLLQGTVVAQELNDTAPEDINQPFVTTSFVSVDNNTTFDTVSVDNITLDFVPLVSFDSPSTTDFDITNVTGTVMNDPVPTIQVLTSLSGPPIWTKPNWWRLYRKKFKRMRLKKCIFLDGVAPLNGTTCPVIGSSTEYMCMFGDDQICDASTGPLPGLLNGYTGDGLGNIHPTVNCMCQNSLWNCADWAPCASRTTTIDKGPPIKNPFDDTGNILTCPDTPPIGSSVICASDLRCAYGTETCCGKTFDNLVCQCTMGETFGCFFTDACLVPSCGTPDEAKPPAKEGNGAFCPTTVPMSGDACTAGLDTSTRCAYGSVCCCGQCSDETTCSCDGSAANLFECSTIAIRCSATCSVDTLAPPECPADQPQEGDKCAVPDQTCDYGMWFSSFI